MKYICYTIYIIMYETLVLGGTGYAVFILEQSVWFLIAGIIMSGFAYPPEKFLHGVVNNEAGK